MADIKAHGWRYSDGDGYNVDAGGWVYWDGIKIARADASCRGPLGNLPVVDKPLPFDKTTGLDGQIHESHAIEYNQWAQWCDDIDKKCIAFENAIGVSSAQVGQLNTKVEHNCKILDKRTKDNVDRSLDNSNANKILKNEIVNLVGTVKRLEEKIAILEDTKMDHPSVSQDLINAERYMDDYISVKKKYNRERFVRKQRLKSKLEDIKKINNNVQKVVDEPSDRMWIWWATLYAAPIVVAVACAIVAFRGVF